jgi:hypothetical protein
MLAPALSVRLYISNCVQNPRNTFELYPHPVLCGESANYELFAIYTWLFTVAFVGHSSFEPISVSFSDQYVPRARENTRPGGSTEIKLKKELI